MKIVSPLNGYVVSLLVEDGAEVVAGSLLLSLDDEHIQLVEARLARLQSTVNRLGTFVSSDFVNPRRSLLAKALALSEEGLELAESLHDQAVAMYETGVISKLEVLQAEAGVSEGELTLTRSASALEDFDLGTSIARDAYDILATHVTREVAFSERDKRRLVLRSPAAGRVVFQVNPGSGVGKGQTIGEVMT